MRKEQIRFYNRLAGIDRDDVLTPEGLQAKRDYMRTTEIRFFNRLAGIDRDDVLTPEGRKAKNDYSAATYRRCLSRKTPEERTERTERNRRTKIAYWNKKAGSDRRDELTPEAAELCRAYHREYDKTRRNRNHHAE